MDTVASTIAYASYILNDQNAGSEFSVWSEDMLHTAFNEALAVIATRVPWAFRKRGTITLTPGSLQAIPESMRSNFKVLGQKCHRLGVPYTRTSVTRVAKLTGLADCCPPNVGMFANQTTQAMAECGNYVLTSWALDHTDPSVFSVYPSVPNGSAPVVEISYVDSPRLDKTASTEEVRHFIPMVVHWMLFRAYSTDLKTDDIRLRSEQHFTHFETEINRAMQTYMKGMAVEGDV